jgi:hypothetical protein
MWKRAQERADYTSKSESRENKLMKREISIVEIKVHPVPHWEVAEWVDSSMIQMEWAWSYEEAIEIASKW